ncbi:MAG: guanylate kinase [Betaproteobacteria bacterium]
MAGCLYIVAAPSGAGKTTLVRQLIEGQTDIRLSISYTTRLPRPGEIDGVAYNFVSVETFQAMIGRGELLEWAEVHGNFYGTSRLWIERQMADGHDVLLEIDWQGAEQVRAIFPQAIGIYILPPSLDELARRLADRATDSQEIIARRLAAAQAEMRHISGFDYVIINDDMDRALEDFRAITRASRLRLEVQRAKNAALFARLI